MKCDHTNVMNKVAGVRQNEVSYESTTGEVVSVWGMRNVVRNNCFLSEF